MCFGRVLSKGSSNRTPLPGTIHALIEERWRAERTRVALDRTASHFATLYQTLMEYESASRIGPAPKTSVAGRSSA